MSNSNKKSVLMDLSDVGEANAHKRNVSILWVCAAVLLVSVIGVLAFVSMSGADDSAPVSSVPAEVASA